MSHFRRTQAVDDMNIGTDDFSAMYAYKCNRYRECLRMSLPMAEWLLLSPSILPLIPTFPSLQQLLDDDISAVCGLAYLLRWGEKIVQGGFSQVTLLLCMIVNCQRKLNRSPTAVANTLRWIYIVAKAFSAIAPTEENDCVFAFSFRKTRRFLARRRKRSAAVNLGLTTGTRDDPGLFGFRCPGRVRPLNGFNYQLVFNERKTVAHNRKSRVYVETSDLQTTFTFDINAMQ